jgi:hypothetical protein
MNVTEHYYLCAVCIRKIERSIWRLEVEAG